MRDDAPFLLGLLALLLGLNLRLRDLLHDGRLRRDHDRHRARFHHRAGLDVREILGARHDDGELLLRLLGVRDFATAEAHGELHLVARFEEAARRFHLEVEVVVVGLRTELDLLDVNDRLLALGLARLLLLLVLVLAEVEDLADRRVGLRVHLDEVESLFLGLAERFVSLQHA